MIRRYRYRLKQDFPNLEFKFSKLSDQTGEVMIFKGKLHLKFTFSLDKRLRTDLELFEHIYQGLKFQIKDLLFRK